MKVKNTIVLVNWTWLTVLERKTPNSQKIYAKHKICPTKNCFAWFWATFVFGAFWYEKVLFVMKRVLYVMKICLKSWKSPKCYCYSQFTKNIRETQNWFYQHPFCIILSNFCFWYEKVLNGSTQGKHREHTGKTHGANIEYALNMGHKSYFLA